MESTIVCSDCLEYMKTMESNSVDSVVTDPPYGLKFMGKDWDHGIPGPPFWIEALRVAKPGCHLLAFGGTRTFHRMTCAIEDAGWEIRDCLGWIYGSGFPKSLDVSKAIDKAEGAERKRRIVPTRSGNAERRGQGEQGATYGDAHGGFRDESEAVTDSARQWQGWGTALKPAWEPIILARKPLEGTVAANVQRWGTGAVNVDGCRIFVSLDDPVNGAKYFAHPSVAYGKYASKERGDIRDMSPNGGRWPANIIHDGSEEVLELFPQSKAGVAVRHRSGGNTFGGDIPKPPLDDMSYGDTGSAARFFYCAKASRREREAGLEGMAVDEREFRWNKAGEWTNDTTKAKNHHPTVKPVALMRYLCRLVTPPNGLILDTFCGSGTTGIAAKDEGFRFIGIDNNEEYCEIARKRINA